MLAGQAYCLVGGVRPSGPGCAIDGIVLMLVIELGIASIPGALCDELYPTL
jgi:hypothetical protein